MQRRKTVNARVNSTQVPRPVIRRVETAPNEGLVFISRSVRGRVEVHGVSNGDTEHSLTEMDVNRLGQATQTSASLQTSSPTKALRKSEGGDDEAGYSTRSSNADFDNDITLSPPPDLPTKASDSKSKSLVMKRQEKRRVLAEKLSSDARNTKSVSGSSILAQPQQMQTQPNVSLASENSSQRGVSIDNNQPSPVIKLTRKATLLSFAQRVLAHRKKFRSTTNPSFTRAFVFSYFVRIIR